MLYAIMICVIILAESEEVSERAKADEMGFLDKTGSSKSSCHLWISLKQEWHSVLYWTGMRIGELFALTYEDIDLEKRCITINKSYQRLNGKDMITPPKTRKAIVKYLFRHF